MTKLEQVTKGLEAHSERTVCVNEEGEVCPYFSYEDCHRRLTDDALELLKEQESVEPVFDAGDGKTIGQFLCGKCHAKIGLGHPHFCWYCGKAVKWND